MPELVTFSILKSSPRWTRHYSHWLWRIQSSEKYHPPCLGRSLPKSWNSWWTKWRLHCMRWSTPGMSKPFFRPEKYHPPCLGRSLPKSWNSEWTKWRLWGGPPLACLSCFFLARPSTAKEGGYSRKPTQGGRGAQRG